MLQSRKMNKPKLLSLAADVKKLDDHPKDVVKRSMTVIEKGMPVLLKNSGHWQKQCEHCSYFSTDVDRGK